VRLVSLRRVAQLAAYVVEEGKPLITLVA